MRPLEPLLPGETRSEPHKVMTPEEYAALEIKGWHLVLKNCDGFGGVGIRFVSGSDHSNLFHDALTKAHDIARNGTRNTAAWNEILEVVDGALSEARRRDAAAHPAGR